MSKLPDVRGRITYISSYAKQENLYAVYETAYRHYWTELAKCNMVIRFSFVMVQCRDALYSILFLKAICKKLQQFVRLVKDKESRR